jgi:hypothetical protein
MARAIAIPDATTAPTATRYRRFIRLIGKPSDQMMALDREVGNDPVLQASFRNTGPAECPSHPRAVAGQSVRVSMEEQPPSASPFRRRGALASHPESGEAFPSLVPSPRSSRRASRRSASTGHPVTTQRVPPVRQARSPQGQLAYESPDTQVATSPRRTNLRVRGHSGTLAQPSDPPRRAKISE